MVSKQLPENWKETEIGELAEVSSGKRERGGALKEGTVASIGGQHIGKEGKIIWDDMKFINEEFYSTLKNGIIKVEDILVVKDGATTGKIAFVNSLEYKKVAVNEHVFIVRTKKIHPKYLFYFLYSSNGQRELKRGFHGMIGGISTSDVKKIKIILPPLETQKKIVSILEEAEKLKEMRKEADELTDNYLKGVFHEMFSNFSKFKSKKLKEVTNWITQGPNPNLAKEPKSEKYGFIKTKDVYDDIIHYNKIDQLSEEEFEKYKNYTLIEGDLLLAIVGFGSIGKVNIFNEKTKRKIIPTRALALIRTKKEELNPEFLRFYFLSKNGKRIVDNWIGGSTGQLVVKTSLIKEHKIPLPPIELQDKFAQIVKQVILMKEKQKNSREQIDSLFNALMQKAFKGELEV